MSTRRAGPALLLLVAGYGSVGQAFVLQGSRWPTPDATFFADILFTGGTSPSGMTWNQAFREAALSWSDDTAFLYTVIQERADPCAGISPGVPEDGFRSGVGFAATNCGIAFGASTLAITTTYFRDQTTTETDIVFNESKPWDVYSGPWRSNASDFRRVAAHELGHALGLDHEDRVPALMQTVIFSGSNIEVPLADDIAGVEALYGPAEPAPSLEPDTATTNYQDWWWNPALSGMGWNIGQQDNTITVAWYLYDSTENPSFLTLAGPLVDKAVEGTLFRSFGPLPGPGYDPLDVTRTPAGTARLAFQSSDQAAFTYDYDNASGTIALERYTYDLEDFSGDWVYAAAGEISDCTDPSNNKAYTNTGRLSISQDGTAVSVTNTDDTGGICTYNLTLSQRGSYSEGSGTFSCDDGVRGTAALSNVRKVDDFLTFEYKAQATSGETCTEQSKVAAAVD
jgi:hypothetical protein